MLITSKHPVLPAPFLHSFVETFKILLDWLGEGSHTFSALTLSCLHVYVLISVRYVEALLLLNQLVEFCLKHDSEFSACLQEVDIDVLWMCMVS